MKAVEKAYNAVRRGIIAGTYPPGARVTEQEIVDAAGVSRTPVREALRRLQAEGLVQFVPHQGAVVASWTDDDTEDIFELRSMLESYGLRLAAKRVDAEQLIEMRRLALEQLEESKRRGNGYLERIADLNSRFHQCLQDAARSDRLKASLATLIEAPLINQTFRRYSVDALIRSAQHHVEIVLALEAGDAEAAAAVMRSHIYAARCELRGSAEHEPQSGRREADES